jgi:uncharacterized C2H2 Zn-finger protein
MRMNGTYRNLSSEEVGESLRKLGKTAPKLMIGKDEIDEQYLKCPFCIDILRNNDKADHGNTHHHHRCCREPRIQSTRDMLFDRVEEAIKDFCDLAANCAGDDYVTQMLDDLTEILQELEMKSDGTIIYPIWERRRLG